MRAAYGAEKFDRLRGAQGEYDPTNLFHLNQNVTAGLSTDAPSASGAMSRPTR